MIASPKGIVKAYIRSTSYLQRRTGQRSHQHFCFVLALQRSMSTQWPNVRPNKAVRYNDISLLTISLTKANKEACTAGGGGGDATAWCRDVPYSRVEMGSWSQCEAGSSWSQMGPASHSCLGLRSNDINCYPELDIQRVCFMRSLFHLSQKVAQCCQHSNLEVVSRLQSIHNANRVRTPSRCVLAPHF